MAAKKKLTGEKLLNGKIVRPPKKGELAGEWVEVRRRPTQIVSFGQFRGSAVFVWFYDEVDRIRILADGTREIDHIIEHIPGKLDVRDQTVTQEIIALISVGATAAATLRSIFDYREEMKEKDKKTRRKKQ